MDVTSRRTFALALIATVVAAGCGDNATSGSDSEQITRVVRDFFKAAKGRDWDGACDLLSAKAKAEVASAGAFAGSGDCPTVIAKVVALDDNAQALGKLDPDEVKVTDIRVSGDRATARVTPTDDEDPSTRFVHEDGRWMIEADPEP